MNQKYFSRVILPGLIFLLLSSCSDMTQSRNQLYRLVYLGNENTGGTPPASIQALPGTEITVGVNSGDLTKTGYYFTGWSTKSDGSGTSYKPGTSLILEYDLELYAQWKVGSVDKTFYAVTVADQWYTVNARLLAKNDLCIVYGDINEDISPEVAEAIADEYIEKIYPKITGAFGNISYMPENKDSEDGKERIFLLLLDIMDGAAMNGGYVAGYFDSIHMYTTAHSNKAAMLFMDVNPGNPSKTTDFCTVIAHELQHLIHFSNTTVKKVADKNIWINEGLSLAAEWIYGGEQTARINYFNMSPTIPQGNNFFVWDGYWEKTYGDVLANYTTAYLFFRWLGIQAKGNKIYQDIINAPYSDYQAVTGPAAMLINSDFSNWDALLGAWMMANYYQQKTGLYGYNELSAGTNGPPLNKLLVYSNSGQSSFFPGEGVFSSISSANSGSPSLSASSPHIRYIGLPADAAQAAPVFNSGTYTGEALLTFNGNTQESGLGESGYVSPQVPHAAWMSRNAADNAGSPKLPENYPLSFQDMAKKNRRGGTAGTGR
jgi:uncharacterized repeat protein (TIGR02543 family)